MAETNMDVDTVALAARLLRLPNSDRVAALRQAGVTLLELEGLSAEDGVAVMIRRATAAGVLESFDAAVPVFPPAAPPPVGVPPRLIMIHQAVETGADPETYIREEIDAALARGWRPTLEQQGDLHIDADGQPVPVMVPGNMVERPTEPETPTAAAPPALPVRRRNPPPKPVPPQHKRREGLAIQFARTVLAEQPPVGEWVRLDMPVSKSIVSTKAREFASAYNLKFRIRLDLTDPDDPTSAVRPHLFCQRLPSDDTEVLP